MVRTFSWYGAATRAPYIDENIFDRRPNMRMAAIKAKERIRNITTNSLDGNVNNGIVEI